jgi:hypothetical protein
MSRSDFSSRYCGVKGLDRAALSDWISTVTSRIPFSGKVCITQSYAVKCESVISK